MPRPKTITPDHALGHTACRIPDEGMVWLNGKQLCELIGKKTGVSSGALHAALGLLKDGIIEAVASGYGVNLQGLMQIHPKEVKPVTKWSHFHLKQITTKATVSVHIRKAPGLKLKIRKIAEALAAHASEEHILALVNPSRAAAAKRAAEREKAGPGGQEAYNAKVRVKKTLG